jgi:hypothetical protein
MTDTNAVPFDNLQQVFDKAWEGMRSQNWQRATGSDGLGCEYHTPDGLKCAIGHIVPDDFIGFRTKDNGTEVCNAIGSISTLVYGRGTWKDLFSNIDTDDLVELQRCHDHYFVVPNDELGIEGVYDVEAAMRSYAASHGLSIPGEILDEA